MSAESDYLRAERDNVLRTTEMIEDLLDEQRLRELAVSVPAACRDFLTSVS